MSPVPGPRPGGRSARIQQAVHESTRRLLRERARAEITVPMIAADAGVTPSTIYRRWGDLNEVFADVFLERLRPDASPARTGCVRGDLVQWASEYLEETASPAGRDALRSIVVSNNESPGGSHRNVCAGFCRSQIEAIVDRAPVALGGPTVDRVIDRVIAPIVYRVLFDLPPLDLPDVPALVDAAFDTDADREAADTEYEVTEREISSAPGT
ncbi:TetR-like C-terminal domain-containing protein [Rhodococcus sp. HNM0569]|uniref:TetR-like C-terminal domain-containing protein n=1 Tax=Rhodococcus sp. HNM0569 TaxID=2716340 RepID=UPI00146BF8A8|nr:TetR-like C-terminal domain-containing protein [Rhodococcus sp. HNM0569]NLU82453.1 TetR/AcrR family transcriptional regulator [Rhodococcus sp. HNM0569]